MSSIYSKVGGNKPMLNRFDLSYTNTFSAKIGFLYPVQCDEVVPGDVFKMSAYVHSEVMPLVAPLMSDLQMYVHTFFVPYRILYGIDSDNGQSIWEEFITGGEDGTYDTPLPKWSPSWSSVGFSSGKIWDYVGNPVSYVSATQTWSPVVPTGLDVSIAPKYAYNKIYNDYYRDEYLIDEVSLTNEDVLKVSFRKDYFTSALESQQLGTSPALPVTIGNMQFLSNHSNSNILPVRLFPGLTDDQYNALRIDNQLVGLYSSSRPAGELNFTGNSAAGVAGLESGTVSTPGIGYTGGEVNRSSAISIDSNVFRSVPLGVDSSDIKGSATATSFNVSDLRLAYAIQRLEELTMRSGYRYTEWLSAHFNAHPRDERLDRPEYIGGAVLNFNIQSAVQDSSTDSTTPQGNKVGIGRLDAVEKLGNYRVVEHGLIMTLCSIRPKPIYQQGINRQWLRQTRFAYYMPEFAYLSEQGVYNAELYVGGDSDDSGIFGYQGIFNEMRSKNNIVSGAVREIGGFAEFVTARKFSSRPALNQDFIEIDSDDFNQIFAVQNEDNFVVSFSNIIDAYRPLPALAVPGLVDHVY